MNDKQETNDHKHYFMKLRDIPYSKKLHGKNSNDKSRKKILEGLENSMSTKDFFREINRFEMFTNKAQKSASVDS